MQRYCNIEKNWKNMNSAMVLQYWRENKYENYTLCKCIAILEEEKIGKLYTMQSYCNIGKIYTVQCVLEKIGEGKGKCIKI